MDPSKLYETAGRYATFTAVQRLGFLLDRAFERLDLARPLLEIVKSRKCYYAPLSPYHGKKGKFISSWKIIENIDPCHPRNLLAGMTRING